MEDKFSIFGCWKKVYELNTKSDFRGFLKALEVWIERPHVVNRRLMGAVILKEVTVSAEESVDLERLIVNSNLDGVLLQAAQTGCVPSNVRQKITLDLVKSNEGAVADGNESTSVILRKLLPRQLDRKDPMFELVLVDRNQRGVVFLPLTPKDLESERNDLSGCQGWLQKWHYKLNSYRLVFETCGDEKAARVVLQVMDDTGAERTAQQSTRDGLFCPTVQWLQDHLVSKLCKWAEEIQVDGKGSKGSLRLVPLDQYTLVYNRLKQDYGERLVKIWPERTDPQKFVYEDIAIAAYLLVLWEEERDENDLEEKQSFVDLGCGNGLLVHILSGEGHPGTGIDVRRRNIWDLYGGNTRLEERALDPTKAGLFPDVDWLIGNHSDELTPWIPVMAARSSFTTRYFVLPCCLFDFNCKFIRKNNKVTQYRGYLDFVQDVGETCGFQVQEDSLRIPSTKRICQIGRLRSYSKVDHPIQDSSIKDMIQKRGCNIDEGGIPQTLVPTQVKQRVGSETLSVHHEGMASQSTEDTDLHEPSCKSLKGSDYNENQGSDRVSKETHIQEPQMQNVVMTAAGDERLADVTQTSISTVTLNDSNNTSSCFQPRPSKEPMRNCTTLERSLKDFIVNTVARKLLGFPLADDVSAGEVNVSQADLRVTASTGSCTSTWRKGGTLELSEVAQLFDQRTLSQLKNECGGLQTLLRNHYYIFQVVGGVVQIRDWTQESPGPRGKKSDLARKERRSQALWKTSICWFYLHHPDGCPVPTEKCPFAHSIDELRERPPPEYLNSL